MKPSLRKTRSSASNQIIVKEENKETKPLKLKAPINFKQQSKINMPPTVFSKPSFGAPQQIESRKINLKINQSNVIPNVQSKYEMPPRNPTFMSNQIVPSQISPQKQIQAPLLQNLVATANLNQDSLNLKNIALTCRSAEYNPKRFAAVIMRMKDPYRTTALVFKSGKMVITGAKTEQQSRDAARHYAKAIEQVNENQKIQLTDFKIVNMVASASVDHKICLEQLYSSEHYSNIDFNPDTFPGLIYKMRKNPKCCLLIFATGKIVITGCKTREQINQAFNTIRSVLNDYKKVQKQEFKSE